MTRIVAVTSSALLVVALGGCSSTSSAKAPPAPDLKAFLHANYTVTSQIRVPSIGGHSSAIAVVSTGPGLTAGSPIAGGTGDVQVLSYDDQAKRWVLALDASDQLSIVGESPGTPLLDQSHPLSDIRAQVVHFEGRPNPDLVISGFDGYTNHPSHGVGIVRFGDGAAQLVWRSSDQGLTTPVISGRPPAQVLKISAEYFPDGAPACCAVRTYTRTLGADAQGNVVVTVDDRPYLGVWLAPSEGSSSVASGSVVVAVDAGSPASGKLRPGDVILGVDEQTSPSPSAAPLDQVARHFSGTRLLLREDRSGRIVPVPVTLGSALSPAASSPGPGVGYLGIKTDASFQIVDGNQDSPLLVAGVQAGDTLKSVNGVRLSRQTDLLIALWGAAGKEIKIFYVDSAGVSKTVTVTPGALPQSEPAPTILHI